MKLKMFAVTLCARQGGSPVLAQVVDRTTLMPERAALLQSPGEIFGLGVAYEPRWRCK